ncbi:hypothetical protein BCR44DRAFT_47596 [Catenaria anguillulae PL171]|uniref:Uncharacterized protein n=1 Tax=Catenaria anguillulae PL171 TaxID=765915 RepID=A0A1Y2HMU4_9FUNG|nr:hypothetical protein BCR44DRAFT_47596 [Catenaria anguillulae PL171]
MTSNSPIPTSPIIGATAAAAAAAPAHVPAPAEYTAYDHADAVYAPPSPTATLLIPTSIAATTSTKMPTSPIYDRPFSTLATVNDAASMLRVHFDQHSLAEQVAVRKAMLNSAVSVLHTKIMGGASQRYSTVMAIVEAGARRMAAEGVGNLRLVSAYIYPSDGAGSWCEYWPLLAILRAILPDMDGSAHEEVRLVDHIMLAIADAAANHLHPRGAIEVGEHASLAELLWQHPIEGEAEGERRIEWEVLVGPSLRPILGASPVRFVDLAEGEGPVSIMDRTWIIVGAIEGYGAPDQQQEPAADVACEKVDESVGDELRFEQVPAGSSALPMQEQAVIGSSASGSTGPSSPIQPSRSNIQAQAQRIRAKFPSYLIAAQRVYAELWFRAVVWLFGERNKAAVLRTGPWGKVCEADVTSLCGFVLDVYAQSGEKRVSFIDLRAEDGCTSRILLPFKDSTDLVLQISSSGELPSLSKVKKEINARAGTVLKRHVTIAYESLSFAPVVEHAGTRQDGLVEWSIVRAKRVHESEMDDDDLEVGTLVLDVSIASIRNQFQSTGTSEKAKHEEVLHVIVDTVVESDGPQLPRGVNTSLASAKALQAASALVYQSLRQVEDSVSHVDLVKKFMK